MILKWHHLIIIIGVCYEFNKLKYTKTKFCIFNIYMKGRINNFYFGAIIILGVLLLYSYYYFYSIHKSIINKLWGGINNIKTLKSIYFISIYLAAIGFLFTLYFLHKSTSLNINELSYIPLTILLLICASIFWMPLSFKYLNDNLKSDYLKYLIVIILTIVSMSSLYLLNLIKNIKETKYINHKKKAILGMGYFFIHTFFLDNVLWVHHFF